MPNNIGEATVDEVYKAVAAIPGAKQDQLAVSQVSLSNSSGGVIKDNSGKKSLK